MTCSLHAICVYFPNLERTVDISRDLERQRICVCEFLVLSVRSDFVKFTRFSLCLIEQRMRMTAEMFNSSTDSFGTFALFENEIRQSSLLKRTSIFVDSTMENCDRLVLIASLELRCRSSCY